MEPPSDIKQLIFSFLIPEQKLYYPTSAITWRTMFFQSVADGWFPGIAASWWRIQKLRYHQIAEVAAKNNQVEILIILRGLGFHSTQIMGNIAARTGSTCVLQWLLLTTKLDINILVTAAMEGDQLRCIAMIHTRHPDVDMNPAFAMACADQKWPIIKLILALGYQMGKFKIISSDLPIVYFCQNLDCLDLWNSAQDAAKTGQLGVLKLLYRPDMDIQTLILLGIHHPNVVRWSLAQGAVINPQLINIAAMHDCVPSLEILPYHDYQQAFMYAAYYGSRAALTWLRDKAEQDYTDAMLSAAQSRHRGIMRLLRYWNPGNYPALLDVPFDPRTMKLIRLWNPAA